jgi:hypothetical protein
MPRRQRVPPTTPAIVQIWTCGFNGPAGTRASVAGGVLQPGHHTADDEGDLGLPVWAGVSPRRSHSMARAGRNAAITPGWGAGKVITGYGHKPQRHIGQVLDDAGRAGQISFCIHS